MPTYRPTARVRSTQDAVVITDTFAAPSSAPIREEQNANVASGDTQRDTMRIVTAVSVGGFVLLAFCFLAFCVYHHRQKRALKFTAKPNYKTSADDAPDLLEGDAPELGITRVVSTSGMSALSMDDGPGAPLGTQDLELCMVESADGAGRRSTKESGRLMSASDLLRAVGSQSVESSPQESALQSPGSGSFVIEGVQENHKDVTVEDLYVESRPPTTMGTEKAQSDDEEDEEEEETQMMYSERLRDKTAGNESS